MKLKAKKKNYFMLHNKLSNCTLEYLKSIIKYFYVTKK